VKKGTVVEVRFQEVTEDTKLRGAFILKIRRDKLPRECLLSQIK
jgi:ATP-dependent DNA ligase